MGAVDIWGRLAKGILWGWILARLQDQASYLSLQTPTLIVYGELDHALAQESLQQLQHLPNHSVVKLPDAGHACYLHKPRDFHLTLLSFLDHLP